MLSPRLILIVCVALCAPLFAQDSAKILTEIVVIDQTGGMIPGAKVSATNTATGSSLTEVANAHGEAALPLSPGTYTMYIRAPGFKEQTLTGVKIAAPTRNTVTLRIANDFCGPCVVVVESLLYWEFPVHDPGIAVALPLMPLQSLTPLHGYRSKHRR